MADDVRKVILSVDDEVRISEILFNMLKNHYGVLTAESAEKAIEVLNKEHVDLILLDVKMPGLSGFDLCKKLKKDELLRTIPIIFVSAYHSAPEIKEGYEIGANDFIGKPFIKEELFAKVKVHLKFGELSQIESIASVSDL